MDNPFDDSSNNSSNGDPPRYSQAMKKSIAGDTEDNSSPKKTKIWNKPKKYIDNEIDYAKSNPINTVVKVILTLITLVTLIYVFVDTEFVKTDDKIITGILFSFSICFLIISLSIIENCPLNGLFYLLVSACFDYIIAFLINTDNKSIADPSNIISLPMGVSIISKALVALGYMGYNRNAIFIGSEKLDRTISFGIFGIFATVYILREKIKALLNL
jgi:hypothetical protein